MHANDLPGSTGDLIVTRQAGICMVTIQRPGKHNALSRSVLRALRGAFEDLADDTTLKGVVVRGAGESYFAAGGDIADLADVTSEADTVAMVNECRAALDAVRDCPVPVVAVLNGDAIGGGAELAVACDFRIAGEHAHVGFIHGRLAITPAWGGGADLIDLVGASRALRMMVRAELVPAATALHWGLVDVVAPGPGLEAALAGFLEPLLQPPAAVLRSCKAQAIAARRGLSRDERRAIELDGIVTTWIGDDHQQAVARFLAKGERWT